MQLTAARVRIRVSRPISPVASKKDAEAEGQLDKTVRLDSVKQEDYDTVFYPGGHGPLWDLAEDPNSISSPSFAVGKLVALVCHARGVLRHVKNSRRQAAGRGQEGNRVHPR